MVLFYLGFTAQGVRCERAPCVDVLGEGVWERVVLCGEGVRARRKIVANSLPISLNDLERCCCFSFSARRLLPLSPVRSACSLESAKRVALICSPWVIEGCCAYGWAR